MQGVDTFQELSTSGPLAALLSYSWQPAQRPARTKEAAPVGPAQARVMCLPCEQRYRDHAHRRAHELHQVKTSPCTLHPTPYSTVQAQSAPGNVLPALSAVACPARYPGAGHPLCRALLIPGTSLEIVLACR